MFSAHHSKTVMSRKPPMHNILCNSELINRMSLHLWCVCWQFAFDSYCDWKLAITVDSWKISRWKYNFNKTIQPIPASFQPLTWGWMMFASRCWGTYMMLCALPQKCNYSTHQDYRDVWRPKELWLTLTRWCFVFPPHTFPVLVAWRHHAAGWRKAK